jgi:carbon-monoxide dehydrogenase medium subunit
VRVPPQPERATYRKFRSRSAEDRPCVSVAAVRGERLRVVVGAVAGTPQDFPELCEGGPEEVAAGYAERISPMSDARGSSAYRKHVIAAEVRRAVEEVSWTPA